jgi:hypothetical protein
MNHGAFRPVDEIADPAMTPRLLEVERDGCRLHAQISGSGPPWC